MIKIAILGPESSGKTILAKKLADYYNCPWVAEHAREYVENLTRNYTFEDVCQIANKQIEQEKYYEKEVNKNSAYIFFDTELIITKVWFEYKYRCVPEFLTKQLHTGFFDFYLLCAPDLPWEADSVREHGTEREFFFDWYKTEIEQTKKPFVIVNGFGEKRLQKAIKAISDIKS